MTLLIVWLLGLNNLVVVVCGVGVLFLCCVACLAMIEVFVVWILFYMLVVVCVFMVVLIW